MRRYGMTVPLAGPLHGQAEQFRDLVRLGYTDAWSAEANGVDGLTPLALASVWAPELRLGTAILPAYTRSPALMAQSAAAMAEAAPGRFVLGIGSSSDVIVERWNGLPFEEPFKRTRDMVRFLRLALGGEKVSEVFDTFEIKGFRLSQVPEQPPKVLVAALRGGMLRMAGEEADGTIVNWLSADDVRTIAPIVDSGSTGTDEAKEIVARIFVCPSEDREQVIERGRFAMAAYLNVPVYRAFHEWLGRGEALGEHWEQWAAGDRKGSLDKIPEAIVDSLIVHGSPDACRDHIDRYVDNGVTCPALMILPLTGGNLDDAIRDLAPRRP